MIFKTTSGIETKISTNYNKSLNEVISKYLTQIGQTDLMGENRIAFLYNGEKLEPDSKKKIEEYIINKNLGTTIIVIDQNNLIKCQKI